MESKPFKRQTNALGTDLPELTELTNIKVDDFYDNSIATVARMLLPKRRHDEFSIVNIHQYERSSYDFINAKSEIVLTTWQATSKSDQKFEKEMNEIGFKRLPDVSLYLDADKEIDVYQNVDNFSTIIFLPNNKEMMVKASQLAATCFSRIAPWAFKDEPITTEEKRALRLLYDKKYPKFKEEMNKIYDSMDIDNYYITSKLSGFCTRSMDAKINALESRVKNVQEEIDVYYKTIFGLKNELRDKMNELTAARNSLCSPDSKNNDMIEFLKASSTLKVLGVDNTEVYIGYVGYLNDCDMRAFESCTANKNGNYIYEQIPYDSLLVKKFLDAVWKDHRFNVRVYCEWRVTANGKVDAIQQSNMHGRRDLCSNRIPQPHIDRFACFTGYREMMDSFGGEGDFVGIFTTIAASSASLNWNDSTVVITLMNGLFKKHSNTKCMEDRDGNFFTPKEVMEILEKEMDSSES